MKQQRREVLIINKHKQNCKTFTYNNTSQGLLQEFCANS